MDVLEIKVKDRKIVRMNERDFSLLFDVPTTAALEDKLGRDMKSPADWFRIRTKEVRDILEAGFTHYHSEEAKDIADVICSALDPEEIEIVIDAICEAACPKALARLREEITKAQARLQKGLSLLPNVPGGAVS